MNSAVLHLVPFYFFLVEEQESAGHFYSAILKPLPTMFFTWIKFSYEHALSTLGYKG